MCPSGNLCDDVGHQSFDLRFESRCDCVAELYAMKAGYSVEGIHCNLRDGMTAKKIVRIHVCCTIHIS